MTSETENPNPYQASEASIAATRTRATRWMIWAGVVALVLAFLCLVATVLGMVWSFQAIATASSTPAPTDLARGISNALIPSIAAVPLGIIGIVFLIFGFVRRCQVTETS